MENRWIFVFPKGISTKWNANFIVQNLSSYVCMGVCVCRCVCVYVCVWKDKWMQRVFMDILIWKTCLGYKYFCQTFRLCFFFFSFSFFFFFFFFFCHFCYISIWKQYKSREKLIINSGSNYTTFCSFPPSHTASKSVIKWRSVSCESS